MLLGQPLLSLLANLSSASRLSHGFLMHVFRHQNHLSIPAFFNNISFKFQIMAAWAAPPSLLKFLLPPNPQHFL
jgi:hypothetical protein